MRNMSDEKDEPSNHPACAACRAQRKKCAANCLLRRHFPASNPAAFVAVHKVFGVANVTKMLREAESPADQDEIARSLHWESAMWIRDPVRGPYGSFVRAHNENRILRERVVRLRLLLSRLRGNSDTRGDFGNPNVTEPDVQVGFGFQQQLEGAENARPPLYGQPPVGQFDHFLAPEESNSADQEIDYDSWLIDQKSQEKFQ